MAINHLAAIRDGEVQKCHVIGIKKAYAAFTRASNGWSVSSTAPRVTDEQLSELEHALECNEPRIVGELVSSGRKVLTNPRHAKRLASVAHIIAQLDHFKLVRFDFIDETRTVPVFRAVARDGSSFLFRNIPWQSGGRGPELLTS